MKRVFPYAPPTEFTSSFAISASYADVVNNIAYALSASNADTVLFPTSGSPANINVCLLTVAEYEQLVSSSVIYEICDPSIPV